MALNAIYQKLLRGVVLKEPHPNHLLIFSIQIGLIISNRTFLVSRPSVKLLV